MELPGQMMLSVETLVTTGGVLLSGLIGWVSWSARRAFPNRAEFAALKKAIDADVAGMRQRQEDAEQACIARDAALQSQLTAAEGRMGSLATRDDLHRLELTMAAVKGSVSALDVTLQGKNALFERLERQLDRMDQFLRERT